MERKGGLRSAFEIVLSAALGLVAGASMLLSNWVLIPQSLRALFPESARSSGALVVGSSNVFLVLDVLICGAASFLLMWLVQYRRPPHGALIATLMAFTGWAVYFSEVGGFGGIWNSQYPLWYEGFSFVLYPLALGASFIARVTFSFTRGE